MIIDFCTVIFWTVLLAALPFYSLTNSTARPFAPPPFRTSLSAHTALRSVLKVLHGGVGLAQKKSLLGFFWGLQKLKLLHAAKPPSLAFYVLARKKKSHCFVSMLCVNIIKLVPVNRAGNENYELFDFKLTSCKVKKK